MAPVRGRLAPAVGAGKSTTSAGSRRWPRSSRGPASRATTRGRSRGSAGDEARWRAARRPSAEADRDGSLLDVDCACGRLPECLVRWSPRIEPFGLELTPWLAELARARLPQWADRIFIGNALMWEPPRRFDFVWTELVNVSEERRTAYLRRLLDVVVVARGGRLIVCGYESPRSAVLSEPGARRRGSSSSSRSSSGPSRPRGRKRDPRAGRPTRRPAARRACAHPRRATVARRPPRSPVRGPGRPSPG